MPDGLYVDRVRSAFASTWALPGGQLVQGQYYFVPEGTAPFESHLWSANWHDDVKEPDYETGPILDAPQYYVKGETPVTECVPPWVIACDGGRYPLRVQVDMGAMGDVGCNECAALGGVQVLDFQPGLCAWKGPLITFCSGQPGGPFTYQYQLIHNPSAGHTQLNLVKFAGPGPSFAFRAQTFQPWLPFEPRGLITFVTWNAACFPWPPGVVVNPSP